MTDGPLTDFDLDAAVTVSELRRESDWESRRERFGKLRVERRGRGPSTIVGVMVAPEVWRTIKEMLTRLDAIEESEVARLIEERDGAPLVSGPDLAHEVEHLLGQSRSRSSE
jgi:hypothetical protein